jgi:hypothetical protein
VGIANTSTAGVWVLTAIGAVNLVMGLIACRPTVCDATDVSSGNKVTPADDPRGIDRCGGRP